MQKIDHSCEEDPADADTLCCCLLQPLFGSITSADSGWGRSEGVRVCMRARVELR